MWILPNIYRKNTICFPQFLPETIRLVQKSLWFLLFKSKGKNHNYFYISLIQSEGEHPDTFYVSLVLKLNNKLQEKYRLIYFMNVFANIPKKILPNRCRQSIERIIHHEKVVFIWSRQNWFSVQKPINVICHIERL